MAWGVVRGLITAAIPLGVWWLDPANVHALAITLIAAVYIGFAVADGRWSVLAVERAAWPRSSWWSPPPRSSDQPGCLWPPTPAMASRIFGSIAPHYVAN